MGLFDFIKKKLFGKTQKVEESKKVDKKKKSEEKTESVKVSKPKVTKEKKKVAPKIKEEKPKKGILSKIKDALISSPKEKETEKEKPKLKAKKQDKEVKQKPRVKDKIEEAVEEPKAEEVEEKAEEVVEESKAEEIEEEVEEVVEEPKAEEVEEEVEEDVEESKAEEIEEEVEEVVEEPKAEEVEEKVEEVVEESKAEEVEEKAEEVVEEPKAEEVEEEVEEVVEEPKAEEVEEELEEVVEEPKVEEVEEKVEEVVEEPKAEETEEEVKDKSQIDTDDDSESLKKGLEKTKKSFFSKLKSAVLGKSKIDDDVLDDLEEVLITSDVGVETTVKIIERIEERVSKDKYTSINELNNILKEEIVNILAENSSDLDAFDVSEDTVPYVILVVGVNGVGKTTTIGKLAAQFKEGGLKVLIGAADTFRAAAVDQIQMWGKKVGVDVVSHGMNTDPASVAYDTVKKAVEEKYHVVIIDTAGRLHTKLNLMNELSKIKRVVQKFKPDAPHEVMLILDGSTGQNAFVQAEEFTKATDVNSITITKLDGTAKGGVVIGITDRFKIPIKYVGVGEKVGDLKLFHKGEFVSSFFD